MKKGSRQVRSRKRCKICHQWFTPHPRAPHQLCCSDTACCKEHQKQTKKSWWLKNPNYAKSRNPKIRAWAKNSPDYWQKYRKEHPDYAQKERQRMRSVRQKAKNVAKQDAVSKISVEKLESIRGSGTDFVAKQDTVHRQVNGILDYLFWKEAVAKQDSMAVCLSGTP